MNSEIGKLYLNRVLLREQSDEESIELFAKDDKGTLTSIGNIPHKHYKKLLYQLGQVAQGGSFTGRPVIKTMCDLSGFSAQTFRARNIFSQFNIDYNSLNDHLKNKKNHTYITGAMSEASGIIYIRDILMPIILTAFFIT